MPDTQYTLRILALDDDPDDLAILRHHLHGMPDVKVDLVLQTEPGRALGIACESAFDLVFLDYQLGSCLGLQFFQQLRAQGITTPVIMITDQGDEELAVTALHAGISDYLSKGLLSTRSLTRAVTNTIDKHRMAMALIKSREELERTLVSLGQRTEECQSFYHTLSHELKTPLTAAREFVSILLDGLQGPVTEAQHQSLTRALSCCDHMTTLINDILDSARLETGKLSLQLRRVPIAGLIRESLAVCQAFAAQRGVTMESNIHPDVGDANMDHQRMQQVLTNVINNAIKYSPANSRVVVSAVPSGTNGHDVQLSVRDWGQGIPPDKLPHVFERAYQAHVDDATVRGGLGLGLYLCRQLLDLHHGRIEAESTPGQGSTFKITIPAARTLQAA